MAERVTGVDGLPGSGKTALSMPLIAEDALEEALAAAAPLVPVAALGPPASGLMGTLAAEWRRPRLVVVPAPRPALRSGAAGPRAVDIARPARLHELMPTAPTRRQDARYLLMRSRL